MSKEKVIREIAQKHFNIETLEVRKSDSLDFYDCAVWNIEAALLEAYEAGKKATLNALKT